MFFFYLWMYDKNVYFFHNLRTTHHTLSRKSSIFFQLRICRPPQKWPYLHERYAQCWIWWKINFKIFIYWVMVDFVLKIHKKIIKFEPKIGHISETKNRKNWFFIHCSTFRICHINLATFEKKNLSMDLSIWHALKHPRMLQDWGPYPHWLASTAYFAKVSPTILLTIKINLFKSGQNIRKNLHCCENDFLVLEFFLYDF